MWPRLARFVNARLALRNRSAAAKTTFADVAGCAEAKHELQEVVEFLKHPKKFKAAGARVPRGVLMEGGPGVGKTMLARAVAGWWQSSGGLRREVWGLCDAADAQRVDCTPEGARRRRKTPT